MPTKVGPVIIKTFDQLNKVEFYKIMQLRIEVFIIEQDCPYQDMDDLDNQCQHLWVEDNGEIISYLRINPAGTRFAEASFGRIVTKKAYRSRGIAERVIKAAIDLVQKEGAQAIRISAQSYLEKYYEKFGFFKASEEYLEDDIPHIEMLRDA